MDLPNIVVVSTEDGKKSSLVFMPDDVADAFARLYEELREGRITEAEYNERTGKVIAENRGRIGMIKNIGG